MDNPINATLIDTVSIVEEFNAAFEMPMLVDLWLRLVAEEYDELLEAMAIDATSPSTIETLAHVLKEAADLAYTMAGLEIGLRANGLEFSHQMLQSLLSPLTAVINAVGVEKFNTAFERVHASNMSKLGDDGKPVRRADGKVLKGPNYAPPNLDDLVMELFLQANQDAVA